jgi:hypothetical protein
MLASMCVPITRSGPLRTFTATTDSAGGLEIKSEGGDYLVRFAIAGRPPIFGCLFVDTETSVQSTCGMHLEQQRVFVRTTASIPGFSGDVISSSACAASVASPCEPLGVPNLVTRKRILLLDVQGRPVRDARLEFRENSKQGKKAIATLAINDDGVADVSSITSTALLRATISRKSGVESSLIHFAANRSPGQQRIALFHWRCGGNVMSGLLVAC